MSGEIVLRDEGKLDEIQEDHQEKLKTFVPIVVICGPGKCDDGSCDSCDEEKKAACLYIERLNLRQRK